MENNDNDLKPQGDGGKVESQPAAKEPRIGNMTINELIESHCGAEQARLLLEDVIQKYRGGLQGPAFQRYLKQVAENM